MGEDNDVICADNHNSFFRQLIFLIVLVAIGWVICGQLSFFLGSLLGAVTLYMVFRGLLFRMTERWNWPRWIAGLVLTVVCLLIIAGAGYLTVRVIVREMPAISTASVLSHAENVVQQVNERLDYEIIPDDIIRRSGTLVTKLVSSVINTTYNFTASVFMMLIILYFMFTAGRRMERAAYQYAPFEGQSLRLLRAEFKDMILSNAVGIPLILLAQTLVASLIYWLIGFQSFLFWGFLTGITGLVPIVGTALVWVPIAIYLALTGNLTQGIIVAAYGVLIIANTDNVIRIVWMKQVNDTHPLIVIFGVILGIPLFGFWGIIFGPLMISAFLLLVRIYYIEYGLFTSREEAEKLAAMPSSPLNPPPMRSINDLHGIRAIRRLKTARPAWIQRRNRSKEGEPPRE